MSQSAEPPRGPRIEPKLQLSWKQRIGFPLLLVIPILALFGVFGESQARAHAASASVDVVVSYPARLHYRQVESLRVRVRNESAQVLDTIHVAFDTAFISRFSGVRFDPAVATAYTVDLTSVKPSESRLVSVEVTGQNYGRHRGTIAVSSGSDSAIVRLRTLVFP